MRSIFSLQKIERSIFKKLNLFTTLVAIVPPPLSAADANRKETDGIKQSATRCKMPADQRAIFRSMLDGSTSVGARLRGASLRTTAIFVFCKCERNSGAFDMEV